MDFYFVDDHGHTAEMRCTQPREARTRNGEPGVGADSR
jgi:hypothetical protein